MGRVFSIDFEYPNYYMCKNCRIHIAVPTDPDSMPQAGQVDDLFITVINVEVDNQCRQLSRTDHMTHVVSDVYCVKCGQNLGIKYMLTVLEEIALRNDLVELEMKKLLWRKGDEIRDAETLIVIE